MPATLGGQASSGRQAQSQAGRGRQAGRPRALLTRHTGRAGRPEAGGQTFSLLHALPLLLGAGGWGREKEDREQTPAPAVAGLLSLLLPSRREGWGRAFSLSRHYFPQGQEAVRPFSTTGRRGLTLSLLGTLTHFTPGAAGWGRRRAWNFPG